MNIRILLCVVGLCALCIEARLQPIAQPIGIDFDQDLIVAAYAHAADNVSVVGLVHPSQEGSYYTNMFRLRLDYSLKNTIPRPGPGQQNSISNLRKILIDKVRFYFLEMVSQMTLNKPAIKDSWVAEGARWIMKKIQPVISKVSRDPLGEMTLDSIRESFVGVLSELKKQTLENEDIDIESAVFAIPAFFNETLVNLLHEASHEVGISTPLNPVTRTVATTITPAYYTESNTKIKYLIIDQGRFHYDMGITHVGDNSRSKRIPRNVPFPMFGSHRIDGRLTELLVSNSEELQLQISLGGSKSELDERVRRARFLIRDDMDAEFLGLGVNEDHHNEEYPVDMVGWGVGNLDVVLSWDDVQTVEKKYVDSLGKQIFNFLVAVRRGPNKDSSNLEEIPETIDKVVILTSETDGKLLKQAVRKALGNDIEIEGGSMHDLSMAAVGVSRYALKHKTLVQEQAEKRKTGHNEL